MYCKGREESGTAYEKRLVGLAAICLAVSLFLPIWSLRTTSSGGFSYDVYVFGVGSTGSFLGSTTGMHLFTDLKGETQGVIIVLLSMTMISLGVLLVAFKSIREKEGRLTSRKIGGLLAFSAVLTFFTPLEFSYWWPSAMFRETSDGYLYSFWGVLELNGVRYGEYGPGIGWCLQVLAFVLVLFAIVISISTRTRETAT